MQRLEGDLEIPWIIILEILTEGLGIKCVALKFILQLQSQEQKNFYAEVTQHSLQTSDKTKISSRSFIEKMSHGSMAITLIAQSS